MSKRPNLIDVGARSELIASAWLIGKGYNVFRNVSPSGPADIIAWNPDTGETLYIDVTTGRWEKTKEGIILKSPSDLKYRKLWSKQLILPIKILIVDDTDVCYWAVPPKPSIRKYQNV